MKIDNFILENWLNPACDSEKNKYYLGGSCVSPMTMEELFQLMDRDIEEFFEELKKMSLAYPRFEGTALTKKGISKLYKDVDPNDVILVHGGTGANSTVCYGLLDPEKNIVAIMPNYQQFYSIPKSIGMEVRDLWLKAEEGYKLDLKALRNLVDDNTQAIMLTNPNNPTGALLTKEEMDEIVDIATSIDAYIICDEMYRGLKEDYMPSFMDLYDKAIVTASSSKIYSMAGLRVGWIVCRNEGDKFKLNNWRSFDSICGGVFDEWVFGLALEHVDKIYDRSRKIIEKNKEPITKWIESNPYLSIFGDSYSTTYLVHYDLDMEAEDFCNQLLDQKGVLVCHGGCFSIPHSFRISLADVHGDLDTALSLIDEFIEEVAKKEGKK